MSDINKRIAVEVMGWKHDFTEEGKEWGYYNNKVGFYRKYIRHDHFNPSTDYNDASMVVDKMREDGWAMYLTVDPKPTEVFLANVCEFEKGMDTQVEYADTPQMAICLAALKVKEGEG